MIEKSGHPTIHPFQCTCMTLIEINMSRYTNAHPRSSIIDCSRLSNSQWVLQSFSVKAKSIWQSLDSSMRDHGSNVRKLGVSWSQDPQLWWVCLTSMAEKTLKLSWIPKFGFHHQPQVSHPQRLPQILHPSIPLDPGSFKVLIGPDSIPINDMTMAMYIDSLMKLYLTWLSSKVYHKSRTKLHGRSTSEGYQFKSQLTRLSAVVRM